MSEEYLNHNKRRKRIESTNRKKQLDFVYKRDRAVCQLCFKHVKREDASRDHIKPLALCTKAEARDLNNMQLAHIECNQNRHLPGLSNNGIEPVEPLQYRNSDGQIRLSVRLGEMFPELKNLIGEANQISYLDG